MKHRHPPSPAGSGIRRLAAIGGALGLGALLLALWPRHEPAIAPMRSSTPAESSAAPPSVAPAAPAARGPHASPPADGPELDEYGMPPPSPDQIRPRPEQRPPTPAEQELSRQAAIRLVESSITRLEGEGRSAAQAGDAETALRNRIRVERLRQRLARLKQDPASTADPAPAPSAAPSSSPSPAPSP